MKRSVKSIVTFSGFSLPTRSGHTDNLRSQDAPSQGSVNVFSAWGAEDVVSLPGALPVPTWHCLRPAPPAALLLVTSLVDKA